MAGDGRRRPSRHTEANVARRRLSSSVVALVGLGLVAAAQSEWRSAHPDYDWQFPADHWSHDGFKTEWWYFTGHLTPEGAATPRFGYQFTFFRVGLLPEVPDVESSWATKDLIMGHAAVTDLATGRHVFSEVIRRATPLLGQFGAHPDTLLAWSRGPTGNDARWTLAWNGSAFDFAAQDNWRGVAMDLSTRPAKPRVFQGPNGYSRKGEGPGAASQYYSFTRLNTTGTLTLGNESFEVSGTSWMDHEFGSNQLGENQVGWDWFSLQLDDGREIMLYELRSDDGASDFERGTVVAADGAARYMGAGEWTSTATAEWRSPDSDAEYPARWRIAIPSERLDLQIVPLLSGQENVSTLVDGLYYWEGAVEVRDPSGRVVGRGFVELTGYGESGELPI